MRFHKTIDICPEKVDTSGICHPKKLTSRVHTFTHHFIFNK